MRFHCAALTLALALCGFATTTICRGDELPALPVTPGQTKILILPTLDETGDRVEMQREHVVVANHRLEYEFMTRGFQVIGPKDALRAARSEEIDLDDPDGRGANSLKTLGKDTGADWVVTAAVVEVHDDKNSGFSVFFSNRRAYAKVQIKIYDMHQVGYIENRFDLEHKTTVRALPGVNGIGTTGLFKDALDTTVQRSVANLLAPYPQTVHVNGEFEENDLLDKQADAAKPTITPVVSAAPAATPTPVKPPTPVAASAPTPPPAPVTTRFTKNNGDVVEGVIDHHDTTNGLYFVKVSTGMVLVKDADIASMTTVTSTQSGGAAQ